MVLALQKGRGAACIHKGVNGLLPLGADGPFQAFQSLECKHSFKSFLSQTMEKIDRISKTAESVLVSLLPAFVCYLFYLTVAEPFK